MASKRHARRRSCESKIQHATQEEASAHTRMLGPGYHWYKCRWCKSFHVGRYTKAAKNARSIQGYHSDHAMHTP